LLICAACHQPTGLGQEGLAPPLAASDWAVGPESRLVRIVLQGIGGPLSVNGKEYSLDMPGLALALNDEQIAQILSYIRRDLGNEAPVVSTASVKKIRDATKDRGASWTADELRQIN
jgi:mono/diheme cytochrome c family protein